MTQGYAFKHDGKAFTPEGLLPEGSDPEAHNKALEAAELAAWAEAPDRAVAYVTLSTAPKAGESYILTTWLGTKLGDIDRYRDYRDGLGHNMRSIKARGTNGAAYYGRYGYDWSQAVRLRKAKAKS